MYRSKSSSSDLLTVITIGSNSTLTKEVNGLGKYTEYEFQVLAFSSVGNSPSSVKVVRTNEDGKRVAKDYTFNRPLKTLRVSYNAFPCVIGIYFMDKTLCLYARS